MRKPKINQIEPDEKVILIDFDDYLQKKLQNPKFKEVYEKASPRFELWYQLKAARIKKGLTQEQLARVGQTQVSKLERPKSDSCTLRSLINFVDKLEDYELEITIKPKQPA